VLFSVGLGFLLTRTKVAAAFALALAATLLLHALIGLGVHRRLRRLAATG
jgi:hypothetical protein